MPDTPPITERSVGVIERCDDKPHPGRRMTEDEFVAWADDAARAEWVEGEVIMMSPISDDHDEFQWWLKTVLRTFAKRRGLGRVKGPEFMIRLGAGRSRRVPDVLFVSTARLGLIRHNHLEGPPDLAVELVSPESRRRDRGDKFAEYAAGGIAEYWVIDRGERRAEAYALVEGSYQPIEPRDEKIVSTVVPGFYLRTEWLLADEPPDEQDVLRELLGA